jgi:anti-sigma-K factor RskA
LNIQEYIETGILEAYVLGELTEAERVQVEKNISMSPELKTELRKVEETLESFVRKASIKPRAELKSKIMDKIPAAKAIEKTEALKAVKAETKVVAISSALNYWKYATAASVAVALFASVLAYNYRSRLKETTISLNNLIAQNQQMAQDYNTVNQKLDKIENDFSIIENASFAKVVMKGTPNDPEGLASVYWNPSSKEVFLSIQQLKSISKDNQFQLWAIVDGKPIDAGVFDGGFNGLLKMKNITGATAFAVTVEPRGGKESPTLETMRVMGAIIPSKS